MDTAARTHISSPSTPVVVAIDEQYSDNNGASSIAIWWDGKAISRENYANGHNGGCFSDRKVNASQDQILAASNEYRATSGDDCKGTYIGCVVKLARSRKAPNGIALSVLDHHPAEYQQSEKIFVDVESVGYRQSERICVSVEGGGVWVSIGCIKSVQEWKKPWWG